MECEQLMHDPVGVVRVLLRSELVRLRRVGLPLAEHLEHVVAVRLRVPQLLTARQLSGHSAFSA